LSEIVSRELLDTAMAGVLPEPRVPAPDPARRSFRLLAVAAPLAIVLAVLVNWYWVPDAHEALPGPALTTPGIPGIPEPVELEKAAVEMLPERVLQYETITRQAIPGYENRAGEAVYKTLNMNTEAQIAIVVYARAEGFASAAEAKARLDEFMTPYSANRSQIVVNGVTPATMGEAPDGGAYSVGWARGNYATLVKSSFAEWTPVDQVGLIKRQGDQIVDAVDVFQRTGREGVSK
jgi:hypothetical protein